MIRNSFGSRYGQQLQLLHQCFQQSEQTVQVPVTVLSGKVKAGTEVTFPEAATPAVDLNDPLANVWPVVLAPAQAAVATESSSTVLSVPAIPAKVQATGPEGREENFSTAAAVVKVLAEAAPTKQPVAGDSLVCKPEEETKPAELEHNRQAV
jgi:hypothetical protein